MPSPRAVSPLARLFVLRPTVCLDVLPQHVQAWSSGLRPHFALPLACGVRPAGPPLHMWQVPLRPDCDPGFPGRALSSRTWHGVS